MGSRDKLDKYTRMKSPDKEALADLVIRAKGPRRSLRQFAEILGVNASTLSRIVNQKTASANSDNLIADIADHADPDSDVTFEQLMAAHGMVLKERTGFNEYALFMDSVSDIVMKELIVRGYIVKNGMVRGRGVCLDSIMGRCFLDFELHTNALGKEDAVWLFDFYAPGKGGVKTDEQQLNRIRQWMLMYAGMLGFNEGKVDRLSVVLADRRIYEQLLVFLEGYTLRYEMSVILIDLETRKVIEEYVLRDKPTSNPVFYPLTEEEQDEPEEKDDDFVIDEKLFLELIDPNFNKEETE